MLSMLGIEQISVIVNKMDLVDYSREVYNSIVKEYSQFLADIDIEALNFIPVSGIEGDNVASASDNMDWYQGNTVLDELDSFENKEQPSNRPFRMPVQDVYKFTRGGDKRRIAAGTAL